MKKLIFGTLLLCGYGCSSDDSGSAVSGSGGVGGSHVGGAGEEHASEAGAAGEGFGGAAGLAEAGAAGAASSNLAGAASSNLAGAAGEGGGDAAPTACSAARAQLLGSIDTVSTGDVSVVSTTASIVTLYVGATAGGAAAASMNPWTFVSLASSSKVAVSDVSSTSSTDWDLALKRPLLYTNGADGGPGEGGAVLIDKAFESVTTADATVAAFAREKFFDAQCNPNLDPTGAPLTSFATWYDYDPNSHVLTPHPGTWLVRGATGKLFKLRFKTYYGTPTGGTSMAGGAYLLEVGAL